MVNKESKIVTIVKLLKITKALKKSGKKIVHCHGVFDLIHPGHIRYFKSAKKFGDVLIVTVTGDKYVRRGPGRPIFNEQLRAEVLASFEIIDYVIILQSETATEFIKKIAPHIYVKGSDHKLSLKIPNKIDKEEEAVKTAGGKIVFTNDEIIFSSSHLINQHLEMYPEKTKKYLEVLSKKYTDESIIDLLSNIRNIKILVIGDAIIDQYHYTRPMGKSSKEPLVVHIFRGEESFAGGALATANHLAALSDSVHLITLLGKQLSFDGFIRKHLRPQIKPFIFYQNDAPTIIKRRFIDEVTKQKLFQISYMKDEIVTVQAEKKIVAYIKDQISTYDMVIVNDFGHGLLSPKIIRLICNKAKYIALNVQANSANYGFNVVTKYPRADYVCMDEHELRLATHDKHSDIIPLMKKVIKHLNCHELVVTRGSDGSISMTKNNGIVMSPALSQTVVDRVGAGDAFFAISSPCAYIGMDQALVSFIGNVAGALKVQSVGNKTPIELDELTNYITRLLK